MKNNNILFIVAFVAVMVGCSNQNNKVSTANATQAAKVWVDETIIKSSLTTGGITYPANKTSIIDHLTKVGSNIPAMDLAKLKNIPDKTFMSADEVISSAK